MEPISPTAMNLPAQAVSSDGPDLPSADVAKLVSKNQAAIRLLDSWDEEEDQNEEEQRETMAILREALGENRIASSRNLFP